MPGLSEPLPPLDTATSGHAGRPRSGDRSAGPVMEDEKPLPSARTCEAPKPSTSLLDPLAVASLLPGLDAPEDNVNAGGTLRSSCDGGSFDRFRCSLCSNSGRRTSPPSVSSMMRSDAAKSRSSSSISIARSVLIRSLDTFRASRLRAPLVVECPPRASAAKVFPNARSSRASSSRTKFRPMRSERGRSFEVERPALLLVGLAKLSSPCQVSPNTSSGNASLSSMNVYVTTLSSKWYAAACSAAPSASAAPPMPHSVASSSTLPPARSGESRPRLSIMPVRSLATTCCEDVLLLRSEWRKLPVRDEELAPPELEESGAFDDVCPTALPCVRRSVGWKRICRLRKNCCGESMREEAPRLGNVPLLPEL
mmetsp:Transcript_10715/g.26249  ORF Transcript_10715/g.26249 Transcript_10715/m.26249 type:complete len:367 (-) Transcript_10715:3397-4497(-)